MSGKSASALESILGTEALQDFLSPGQIKHGLPSGAYTSQDFFDLEQEKVFAGQWAFVGFAHELAEPGDMAPLTAAGLPVVLVRGKDREIRAFHNVCRHRGFRLVGEPCRGKRMFACPYHAWTYELNGKLRAAPHFGGPGKRRAEGFDYEDHGLKEIPCRIWHDWIFINIDGRAMAFEDFIAPLQARVADMDLGALTPLFHIDSGDFKANWKFICENFIEPYHVPVTHPETAAGQPLKDHYLLRDKHLVGCAIDLDEEAEKKPQGSGGANRGYCLDISARYFLLFPNFLFFIYFGEQTHVNVMLNTPLAPDRNHQRRVIYQLGGEAPTEDEIEGWRQLNNDVVAEDRFMVEGLQEGRKSPVMWNGGVLSPAWEGSQHAFQELIVEAMGD
ncbi:MAG: aromatic ring-hydroxylating dioxygenase subunit alpha [Pseudomonadota bacterium]